MRSAVEERPRLEPGLRIVRRQHEGRVHFVVKQPRDQKYYRFGDGEIALLRLMDGTRTAAELAGDARRELGVAVSAGQVADFAARLKRLGIVERTPAERHLMLMERLRADRKVRARGRMKGSLLRLRFSIGDPDRLFGRLVGPLRWLWSPPFVAISLALFAGYAVVLGIRWEEFWSGTTGLYTLSGFGATDWVLLYGAMLVTLGVHELGHGLTTKHFGGEVHEIGAMLLYFSPALFCNTNDAWTFQRRAHRLWVTFAGPWIQLCIASVAALAWLVTEPGTLIHRASFLTALGTGALSVLMNFNPLIPLDGYYALADWLEISNLRGRAFAYWGWLARRFVLGIEAVEPPVTPRERRVFLIYGGLALAYSLLVAILSFVWLVSIFGRFIGPWVWVLVALLGAGTISRAVRRTRGLAGTAAVTLRARFRRNRRFAGLAGAGLLLLLLSFVLPWTFRASGPFRVEAVPRAEVRAQVDGVLTDIEVREGDTVRAGDVLARLWNPGLEAELHELEAAAAHLSLERAGAERTGDLAAAAAASDRVTRLQDQLGVLRARQAALVVRAPITGIVIQRRLRERLGEPLAEGEQLVKIASLRGRLARVRVPLTDAEGLAAGRAAGLKVPAWPRIEFRSRVSAVAPMAGGHWLEATIPFPAAGPRPAPGMEGTAKIVLRRGTIAQAVGRMIRRTIRLDLWL